MITLTGARQLDKRLMILFSSADMVLTHVKDVSFMRFV